MSGIIKSGNLADLTAVRAFAAAPPLPEPPRLDEERERLRRRVAALEGELRQRDTKLEELRAEVKRAYEAGTAEGHAAGLADARDRQAERLALLEESLHAARAKLSAGVESLQRLAPLLARECLDRMLGGSKDRAALLGRMIETQIGKIDKAMLLGIEVSRADFADDGALAALSARIGQPAVTLKAGAGMPSGGCVMTLKLGQVSVGLDQQWGVLRDLLTQMALPGDAA